MLNEEMLKTIVWLPVFMLIACIVSMICTRICIKVLPYFGMVDIPRGRHQHAKAVPRGGGIAIIISFVLTVLFFILVDPNVQLSDTRKLLLQLSPPVLIIAITGLMDDRYELKSWMKLFVQIAIACYFYFTGAGISTLLGYSLPGWIALPFTICWCIGITNAFNLIDGMDGIAAGLSSIAAFAMTVWLFLTDGSIIMIFTLMIFCGSCLGFLRYNFSPAKIFMGDTGSLFIGLIFSFFSMSESTKAITLTSLLVPVLAMGVPVFDVFLAIIRRLFRKYIKKEPGVGIMTGDHDHLHHRIQQQVNNPKKTAFILYFFAFLLAGGAILSALVSNVFQTLSFAVLLVVIFVVVRFATIEFFDAAKLISEGIHIPRRNFLLTAAHPVVDFLLLVTAYALTSVIFQRNITFSPFTLKQALCYIAPFPVVLALSGVYRTFWLRPSVVTTYKLLRMLFLASVISLGLALGFILVEYEGINRDQISIMREFFTAYIFMGIVFIFLERFMLHYVESFLLRKLSCQVLSGKQKIAKTLVYGGGLYCKLFLTSQYCISSVDAPCRQIIGLIDDNPSLQGLVVYGMRCLGGSDDLGVLKNKYDFDEIVIALKLIPEETREKIVQFGKENGIAVHEFSYTIGDPLIHKKNS